MRSYFLGKGIERWSLSFLAPQDKIVHISMLRTTDMTASVEAILDPIEFWNVFPVNASPNLCVTPLLAFQQRIAPNSTVPIGVHLVDAMTLCSSRRCSSQYVTFK